MASSNLRDEVRLVCRFCGAVYNTHYPESPPTQCYECGEGHPWEQPTEIRYGVKISAPAVYNKSWEAFRTRHEAVGEAAIRNRRNPDVDWFVSVDDVVADG